MAHPPPPFKLSSVIGNKEHIAGASSNVTSNLLWLVISQQIELYLEEPQPPEGGPRPHPVPPYQPHPLSRKVY